MIQSAIQALMPMVLIIIMNCCFAAALPLLKYALQHIDPFLLVAFRMLGAGAVLCLAQLWHNPRAFYGRLNWKLLVLNGLLSMSLLCMLEAWALQGISATKANLMWATLPLLTALAVRLWEGTSLQIPHILGIGLGLVGILLLISTDGPSGWPLVQPSLSLWYDSAMLLAVVIAAIGYLCTQQLVDEQHPVVITNGISMLLGGIFSLAGTYCLTGFDHCYTTSWLPAWGYIASIIIIVNLIGLSLQMWLTKTHSVTLLALSSFITPLCGALFGILQGDMWNHSLFGAALCIGSGLYIFYHHDMKRISYA